MSCNGKDCLCRGMDGDPFNEKGEEPFILDDEQAAETVDTTVWPTPYTSKRTSGTDYQQLLVHLGDLSEAVSNIEDTINALVNFVEAKLLEN